MAVDHDSLLEGALAALAAGRNGDPFAVLGPHADERGGGSVVRAFQPAALAIDLRAGAAGEFRPMTRRDPAGLFDIRLADATDYRFRITYPGGHLVEVDDPYRYGRVLTDVDLHLLDDPAHQGVRRWVQDLNRLYHAEPSLHECDVDPVCGGSNVGNLGGTGSEPVAAHGFDQSIRLMVPPLGCLFLKKR